MVVLAWLTILLVSIFTHQDQDDVRPVNTLLTFSAIFVLITVTIIACFNLKVCDYITVVTLLVRIAIVVLLFKLRDAGYEYYNFDRKLLFDTLVFQIVPSLLLFTVNWKIELCFTIPVLLISQTILQG